jgi:hypothetical protein
MVNPEHQPLLLVGLLHFVGGCGSGEAQADASALAASQAHGPPAPRIVAVGDLHGDLSRSLEVLRLAGVVDEAGHWSGGAAVLVQTGDQLDRGDQGVETLDLLQRLEGEALAAGGRVVVLLGNHEAMNLGGDWRYVTEGDIAGYGGLEARQRALSPAGEDGAWLGGRPVAVKLGRTVFAHGGVTPTMAELGLEPLNAWARAALQGAADPAVLGQDGPLWYRGYLQDDITVACPALERALLALGAERMVVGHTTQRSGRIAERCGGALIGIDTGISAHYGAHIAALELRGGEDAWALYPDGPEDLRDP